jgi:hypothetical protein
MLQVWITCSFFGQFEALKKKKDKKDYKLFKEKIIKLTHHKKITILLILPK